ncbi:MAG TPA: DNA double-strand break repair nuclease NurA [Pyrinomonadaceae bacterium]|nr:DNA double-strand break repair nuclease NurA [Pyrinomonadaceae bacterium]
MLFRQTLNDELEKKSEEFLRFISAYTSEVDVYLESLARLEKTPSADIRRMKNGGDGSPAAIPSDEMSAGSFTMRFSDVWENHEQARGWASDILDQRVTFAADGSQIYTGKETLVPIAAVQIGWFENPHDLDSFYEKNARFQLLTPADLLTEWEEPMNPDIRVEAARYLGEVERLGEFLQKKTGWRSRGERMPLAFFDNPLLVPFSQKGLQKKFLDATVRLVQQSKECEVPLVGYVDRSYSRDILSMLEAFCGGENNRESAVFDASVLRGRKKDGSRVLNAWGERTCFCYSTRRGLEAFLDASTGRSSVGFTYLQTTAESAPARLDLPSWIHEHGLLEEVVDTVRAECVIGLGYPYVLETADQAAVISTRDREVFFRALQELTTREKLDFSVARKDASKQRRR